MNERAGGRDLDCLLVADDLTGACDAAVHFAVHGIRPAAVLFARGTKVAGARVLAVSTESRDLPPAEIRPALADVAAEFPGDAAARVFKKIDSTLRGNTGLEIAAALESFDCDAAVVCPAFPRMHRVVENGFLRVTSAPEFAPIDVAARLQLQSGLACSHTRADGIAAKLSAGSRLVSVDANCDDDLDRIAATILPMGRRILWAGSAGLASALARRLGDAYVASGAPARSGAALFCIGSDHDVTMAQQSFAAGRETVCDLPSPRRDTGRDLRCDRAGRTRDPADCARPGHGGRGARTDRRGARRGPGALGWRHGIAWSAARPECSGSNCVMKSFLGSRAAFSMAETSTAFPSRLSPAVSAIATP